MLRRTILATIVFLTITFTGCWPYPLISSKQATPDEKLIGQWHCTDLVDIKEERYKIHDVNTFNVSIEFLVATQGQHNEPLPKHVMLYHPNLKQKLPFTPPLSIGDAPDNDEKVYCWATELEGRSYLVFQFFDGPIQTDLTRRKDPEFLIYRYQINGDVLQMFDLDQKIRKRIAKRLGEKKDKEFSQQEMQKEILRIQDRNWKLHIRAERIN
jgi:hypothetical protein